MNWTQTDLAREATLSKTAIVQFETAASEVRRATLRLIVQAFARYGIEFTPPNGVNRRPVQCQVFADDAALTTEWPAFLKSLTENGFITLTVWHWPDFVAEFTTLTNVAPNVIIQNTSRCDRAVCVGPWVLMPIWNTPYRMALYQRDDGTT